MCTEPTRYTAPCPRVALNANARVSASGCAHSAPATSTAATILWVKRGLEIIEAPLDAVGKGLVEVDAVTEIAHQVGHGHAAGLRQRAPRIGTRMVPSYAPAAHDGARVMSENCSVV